MGPSRSSWIAASSVLLAGALLGCTRQGSLDLPLMLANGARILDDGAIPRTNVFSWVNSEHSYLNDKWGFMVLVAGVERLAGVPGLAALKMVLGASLGGLLHLLARRVASPWRAAGIACLALTMVSYRLHLRAEWLSYVGVATVLLLLPGLLAGRRGSIVSVLLLMPVWAACHGYWVLGPILVLAAAAGARSGRGALVGLGCAAAAAVSPYGVDNLLHPFGVLEQLGGPLGAALTEVRAPFTGAAPVTLFHVLAVALTLPAFAAVLIEARARRLGRALVIAALVAVAWRMDRNLALLGLTVPLVAAAAAPLAAALPWGGLVALVAIGGTAVGTPRIAVDRMFGVGEHPDRFPTALVDGLPDAWAQERYVNDLSLGSWLVRARGNAFIDGNTEGYPPAFLGRYRALLAGEVSVAEIEAELEPDGWLLRTSSAPTRVLVLGLFASGDHAPARWDDVATLFRRDLGPEQADRQWQEWLADVYLPRAGAWFVPTDEALELARAALPVEARGDEIALLRAALVRQPWDAALYRRLGAAYAARGELRNAARCRRWAFRIAGGG